DEDGAEDVLTEDKEAVADGGHLPWQSGLDGHNSLHNMVSTVDKAPSPRFSNDSPFACPRRGHPRGSDTQ
ncbi:MAG: hypothetical protein E6614_37850, partial [Bradyrhizobium sp.]|nr:hypothetical protein [Bradyrhizobium sp.]